MALPFRDEHEAALVLVERLKAEIAELREQEAYLSDGRAENEQAFVARRQERAQQVETESVTLRFEMESLQRRNHELERLMKAKAALRSGPGETTGSFLDASTRWFRRG